MKKLLSLVLAVAMLVMLTACASTPAVDDNTDDDNATSTSNIKIGFISVGDENEGYSEAHLSGVKAAMATLGLTDDNVIIKRSIEENSTCYETACELADEGCTYIFSNSYSHQDYMVQAAQEYPDVIFLPATGDTAAVCGLSNVRNYFTAVYQSRYVSGVVAGMKIAELVANGELSDKNYDADGNVKIGYVGAYNYAEVISGYTAFLLGVRSIYENVSMEVQYTSSWFNPTAEGEAANSLIADGCVIIGQHADSTGAPSAVEAALNNGTVCYSVGYNVDMLSVAPNAALTSATNVWEVYYTYAFKQAIDGADIDIDWCKGYSDGAVAITDLGTSCAEGTAEKVAEIEAALKDGSLQVFDTSTFTVDGEQLTSYEFDTTIINYQDGSVKYAGTASEVIVDGAFQESTVRSAPYFSFIIDGVTELN